MSNYLKKSLLTLLILVVSCINFESMAMGVEESDRSTVRTRKISFMEEDQKEGSSFSKQSNSSQMEILEDSQNSLTSYLTSSVKYVFQGTYEIVKFAVQNSKLTTFVALSYIIPGVAALCECYCYDNFDVERRMGVRRNIADCQNTCDDFGWAYHSCFKAY